MDFKYRAFLSYSHSDTTWAKWLHKRLEGFPMRGLAGQDTPLGPVPKTLRPIFRDREDFTGGHTLKDATIAALDQSAALIVLCSPVAATRPAVNEEVRLFRFRHPDRPVIPVIVDGHYPDNFPPALRFELDPDGTVSDRPYVVLGPDLRETGDGKELGQAKLVAGLIGVGTDEIVRRAERERRRVLRRWIVGLSGVAITLAGLAVWAELNRREAVAQRASAEKNFNAAKEAVDSLVFDIAQGLKNVEGMRAARARQILGTAEKTVNALVGNAPGNLDLQRTRAVMLLNFGDVYAKTGDAIPARGAYEESLAIARRLVAKDEGNTGWQRDVSVSLIKLGDLKLRAGDAAGALAAYEESLAVRRKLVAKDEGNTVWQRDVSLSLERLGDLRLRTGNAAGALMAYEEGLAIRRRLVAKDEGNTEWQRNVSVSLERLGDFKLRTGDAAGAQEVYEESLAIRRRLVAKDQGNTEWQRDVSVSLDRLGDLKLRTGDAAGALDAYEKSLAIRRRLVAKDEGNTGWQRDVSVSLDLVGDLKLHEGDAAGALAAYEESLAIRRGLVAKDGGNTEWQRDLSVSLDGLGNLKLHAGDAAGALAAYEESLAVRRKLVAILGPEAVEAQTDLVVSDFKIAQASNDPARRKFALEDASAIVKALATEGLLTADQKGWQAKIQEELAK
jgi:tetratricopeptide (TPR) repeat protein